MQATSRGDAILLSSDGDIFDDYAAVERLTSPLVVEFSGGPAVCRGVVEVVIGSVG
jgi:hypothetical protein